MPGGRTRTADLVREAVDAIERLQAAPAEPALGRVAAAIYVEDTFAITLTDDDIEDLASVAGLRAVLARHHVEA